MMSFEEYARVEVTAPYVVALRPHEGDGALLYYGARHSWATADPMMLDLERRFAAFAPTLALNEGGDPEPGPMRHDAIRIHGESGLLVWLAQREGVVRRTLEPSLAPESAVVASAFGEIRAKLFYFLRDFDTYNRGGIPESRERYAKILFDNLVAGGLRQAPTDLTECVALLRQAVPELKAWNEAPSQWFDPAITVHPWLNEAARLSSRFRDEHMVRVLSDALAGGERVFAVVGYSHVVVQEETLCGLGSLTRLRGEVQRVR